MKAILVLLACWRCAYALNPSLDISQYAHTGWTIRDGFFKSGIGAIAQTPDGYLWLGTEFGLLRFDGVRSVPWQPPEGEHLPGDYIRTLLTSRDGRLWIGTREGLASWKDGKLTHYPEFTGQSIQALLEDRGGVIWAGVYATPHGRLCAIQSGSVRCYGEDGSFGSQVLSLYEDSRGNLWAGSSTGLWRWKPGPPKLYPIPDPVHQINGLMEDENGALLIVTRGEIKQLVDEKTKPYRPPGFGQPFIPIKLFRDREGSLWITTADRGLLHVHQGRTDAFAPSDGFSGEFATSLFEDREGNVWAASTDGLDRFRDFAVPTISVKQGLSNAIVVSVLAAGDGSVWVGTNNGLNRWNDGQVTVYRKGSAGLPGSAHSLFQGEGGRIWASTASGVVYFKEGRFLPVHGVPGGTVYAIAGDGAGNLWISNQERGLVHLFGESVEQIPWATFGHQDSASALSLDSVRGGLWLGFVSGGVVHFKDGQVRASYLAGHGRVGGFQLDGDGTLWAASEGGLSRVKDGRVVTLSSKNGLPCDTVHWVMEDNDHSFWLYTACGLVRVARTELDAWAADPKRTIQTAVFDSSDGVRSQAQGAGFSPHVTKTADGKLWFAAPGGVSVVDPRRLPFNRLAPPVHIEQVRADRIIHDADAGMRLPALTRDLEIDYTALSLVAPEKNRFRVKLEGWDRDWKDVGNERKTFYGNLPPRSYRFRVMASNNSGVWNEAGDSFDFSIDPAYYQTRWFQAACAAAFLALLWGIYRYRLHQIAREFNMRLDERVGERTRLARDLHDTLLQGFQGLMLRLQAINESLPEGEIKDELGRTLDRGDQVVTESRKAVHDLRLSTVITNDLTRAVQTMGDELSSEGSATFELLVEGETRELHPIVRDEAYRITREALRNAFSHARARHIEAEIVYSEQVFRLRIRDDGEGIAPAILEEGRPGHYGLPGMRERAAEIGGKLDIWSGAGTGTEIDLSIAGSIAYGKRDSREKAE